MLLHVPTSMLCPRIKIYMLTILLMHFIYIFCIINSITNVTRPNNQLPIHAYYAQKSPQALPPYQNVHTRQDDNHSFSNSLLIPTFHRHDIPMSSLQIQIPNTPPKQLLMTPSDTGTVLQIFEDGKHTWTLHQSAIRAWLETKMTPSYGS